MIVFVPNVDTDGRGRGGVRVELGGVNGTETSVTGLTPGVYYTFSVTAKNAVSSQDNNINARTVRATANTEEGGIYISTTMLLYMYMYI